MKQVNHTCVSGREVAEDEINSESARRVGLPPGHSWVIIWFYLGGIAFLAPRACEVLGQFLVK
jgi:hypothetical protein